MNGEFERTQMVLRLNPQVHLYGSTSPVFSGLWKIYGCPDTLTSSLKHLLLKKLWHWWRSAVPKSFTYSDKMTRPFPFDFMEFCDKIKRRPSLWQMHYMPRRCEWDWSFFFWMIQYDLQSCLRHQTVSSFIFRSKRLPCFWSSKDMNTGGENFIQFPLEIGSSVLLGDTKLKLRLFLMDHRICLQI